MYSLKRLWLRDQGVYKQWASLMDRAGLNKEEELDYTVGIYDNDLLVATGSFYGTRIAKFCELSFYAG